VLGVFLLVGFFIILLDGELPDTNVVKFLIGLPVMAVAFIAYALGGQKLLKKIVPPLAEKEPKASSQIQSKEDRHILL
jgi:multisubunit Na+/H+ antiporter MnhC subunit